MDMLLTAGMYERTHFKITQSVFTRVRDSGTAAHTIDHNIPLISACYVNTTYSKRLHVFPAARSTTRIDTSHYC